MKQNFLTNEQVIVLNKNYQAIMTVFAPALSNDDLIAMSKDKHALKAEAEIIKTAVEARKPDTYEKLIEALTQREADVAKELEDEGIDKKNMSPDHIRYLAMLTWPDAKTFNDLNKAYTAAEKEILKGFSSFAPGFKLTKSKFPSIAKGVKDRDEKEAQLRTNIAQLMDAISIIM